MLKSTFVIGFAALFMVALTSCSEEIESRGYATKFSDFSKIQPGVSTKDEVIQELGSPSVRSMYGEETWFYVGNDQTKETFFEPELKAYDGYEITFNDAGVVSSMTKKDASSIKEIEVSDDYTKTTGNEITWVQQLFGNLGKFNPASRQSRGPTPVGPRGY